MHLADELASEVLLGRRTNATELLMTSVPPQEGLNIKHIHGLFSGKVPLRTQLMPSWPAGPMPALQCLHCGGSCNAGPPLPAARLYDSQQDQYWVYGPFCRPCCAFGYVCETDSTSKQLAATLELMRRHFGVKNVHVAPPRAAHCRFGGPLGDYDFYGLSGYTALQVLQPPFVTFANYVIGVHQAAGATSGTNVSISALLPQSAGRLIGLQRPAERSTPLAEKKPSGKPPLLLEFLATLTSAKDVKTNDDLIDIKATKKRSRAPEPVGAPSNSLRQYVKKPTTSS